MTINEKFGFDRNTSFEEKFRTMIEYFGIENVKCLIPYDIETLKRAYAKDVHFNNLPIATWDKASGYRFECGKCIPLGKNYVFKGSEPRDVRDLFILNGINVFSVSTCVSLLKQCAKMWVEEELEKEEEDMKEEKE